MADTYFRNFAFKICDGEFEQTENGWWVTSAPFEMRINIKRQDQSRQVFKLTGKVFKDGTIALELRPNYVLTGWRNGRGKMVVTSEPKSKCRQNNG